MNVTVSLIIESVSRKFGTTNANQYFTGDLFKKRVSYAKNHGTSYFIMSAKYLIAIPHATIRPHTHPGQTANGLRIPSKLAFYWYDVIRQALRYEIPRH